MQTYQKYLGNWKKEQIVSDLVLNFSIDLALAKIGRLHSYETNFKASPRWSNSIQINVFHSANRLITVRYIAPVDNIIWQRDALGPIGQKIVKLLYDMNFEANPIILHVFSNGGAYLYKYIDLAIKEFQSPLDVGVSFLSSKPVKYIAALDCKI